MSRIATSAPPQEPATFIARALHRRLPERIEGAGTLYLWLQPGRAAARIVQALHDAGREHELLDAEEVARYRHHRPLGSGGDVW